MSEKYKPIESNHFKRGRKLAQKRGLDISLLKWGIEQLAQDIPLPRNWKDHSLKGKEYYFILHIPAQLQKTCLYPTTAKSFVTKPSQNACNSYVHMLS